MARSFLGVMLVLWMTLSGVSLVRAEYYKYTDSNGVVHITNNLSSVPQKDQSRVKVITDEGLSRKDHGAPKRQAKMQQESDAPQGDAVQEAAAVPVPAPEGKLAQLSAVHAWFKPLLFIAGTLGGFLVVIKVASAVPSAQLSKLIYLSFFIGVFVLLYKGYIDHVVADTIAVKQKAINIMKKSNVREISLPGAAQVSTDIK